MSSLYRYRQGNVADRRRCEIFDNADRFLYCSFSMPIDNGYAAEDVPLRSLDDEDDLRALFRDSRSERRWRRIVIYGFPAILLAFSVLLWLISRRVPSQNVPVAKGDDLRYNASLPDRVLNDLSLPHSTCDALFPLHLDEIELTANWTRANGGVFEAEVDAVTEAMHGRILVKDGRMFVRRLAASHMLRMDARTA